MNSSLSARWMIFGAFIFFAHTFTFAQKTAFSELPESQLSDQELSAHLWFLASDEMQGRRTGEIGNQIAGRYIAEQFRAYGIETVPGHDGYMQPVPFREVSSVSSGTLTLGKTELQFKKDFVILGGGSTELSEKTVFVEYGWIDETTGRNDYEGVDVKGKIVLTYAGVPGSQAPGALIGSIGKKQAFAAERGAVAVIELFNLPMPWGFISNYLSKDRMVLGSGDESKSLPHFWVKDSENEWGTKIKEGKKKWAVSLTSAGQKSSSVNSNNVIGVIPGTDPKLKDEYLLLTAHYDHVGTGKNGGRPFSPEDSIFNGARDNGMGTVALLTAAKSLAQDPPARSVIVLALTGEEMGLLGSAYYADHPLIPLNKVIINLNTDGGGYDDTTIVSAMGLERTGGKAHMETAAKAFGLELEYEFSPQINQLFYQSDNASFAAKGIPAPSFSPGFRSFTPEILKYYHQAADNPDQVNMRYLAKYAKVYAHAARLIANDPERPRWVPGDEFEPAAKKLYGYE